MAFKTVTTVVTDPTAERSMLEAAVHLARKEGGHLDVLCLGIDHTQPGVYYSGANALAIQTSLIEAENNAADTETAVKEILSNWDINWATRALAVQTGTLTHILAHHIRFADIAVLARPFGPGRTHEHEAIVESALFDARIPVLVIPDETVLVEDPGTIVVAWNESREALAAIRLALPILKKAQAVNIAIIDPPVHAPNRSDPGGALSQMLSRHGVKAEVSILAKTTPRVSEVIARHVVDLSADYLVMGAYGHSRFRESILGGATRNTLQMAELPVFMAH